MQTTNILIRPFCECDKVTFQTLLKDYLQNDFKLTLSKEELQNVLHQILESVHNHVTSLDLLFEKTTLIGFVNYQIDSKESDWCEKEGYGTIRELYIHPNYRKQGFGKQLASHAEKALFSLGASQIYLTTDSTELFWESCGYQRTEERSKGNNDYIYIKLN